MKPIKIILFSFLLIWHCSLNGQSLVRSSLSSIGSSYTADGFILRQTIGQPSNTSIGYSGTIVLRQGFQQPLKASLVPTRISQIDFTLAPNPASERTLLKFNDEINSYSVTISNSSGMVMTRLNNQNQLYNWLDIINLPPGIYFVTIISDLRFGSKKLIVNH